MQINAIQCNKCGDIIYSRARHDMHWCGCKSIAIDGGISYLRVCGEYENIKNITINVKTTKEALYNDWNKRTDKYGTIKGVKHAKHGTASRRRKSRTSLIV